MSEWKNGNHAGKEKKPNNKRLKSMRGLLERKKVFAKLPKKEKSRPGRRDELIMHMIYISFMIITFQAQCSDDENLYFLRNKTPPKLKAMYMPFSKIHRHFITAPQRMINIYNVLLLLCVFEFRLNFASSK